MRKFYTLVFCILLAKSAFSQLTVNGGFTAQQLAENLAGPNIHVFNASLTGKNVQSGTFSFTGSNFEIGSGILLTSGSIQNAVGPNNSTFASVANGGSGSAELDQLSGKTTFDAVVLQFDFEVQSPSISFNYIFASEEYNEWVGSGFNDVFGFFISGPGIDGLENLAVVPTTNDPITINNINNDSYWQFYRDNTNGNTNIQFDGFTTLMTAKKDGLIPCQVYTLKLIIADASDDIYDSGVFLKENSLVQELVSGVTNTINADGIALEGCYDARFTFSLNEPQPTDTKITYTIGGTAINGVDYRKIDSSIIIPAGQTSATIIIDAYADGIPEPQEVIELSYRPTPCSPIQTIQLFIDDNQPIDFSLTKTDVSCSGESSGQISANITGGFGPYTVTLNDTEVYKSLPITGLAAGTYQVKVDDKYGCGGEAQVVGAEFDAGTTFLPDGNGNVYTTSVNIQGFDASAKLVSASQLQSICLKLEHSFMGDVEMKLIAPDGKAITLKERPGGNNVNFGEPVASGPVDTNSDDVTPGVGYEYCFSNDPVYQTMVEESKNNHTYNYVDKAGNNHHNEKYLPGGAYQPYQSFEGLLGTPLNGDWTIWVKDHKPNDNGYIFKWSISFTSDRPGDIVVIDGPAPIQITGGVTKAACGASDGAIDVTIQGEFGPFTYAWSNGATTEDISGLAAGSYTLTVTDNNNCSQEKTFLVSNAGTLTATANVMAVSCNGGNDGAIVVTPSGGTGNYSYAWSHGAAVKDIENLTVGEYTVTITDNTTGCIALETFVISEPVILKATGIVTNEKCGDREGIISLTASGGTGSYTYTWNNGATASGIKDLQAGDYTVLITDENNCQLQKSFTVMNEVGDCLPDCDLTISTLSHTDETCGQSNGSISISISTINGPYSFVWSNNALTKDLSGIHAGEYSIYVKDKAGCEASESFTIQNNTGSLALAIPLVTNEQCGGANGMIDISVTGGSAPYSFLWSNGKTIEDITGLAAGTYTVKITDQNNCSFTKAFTIANETGSLYQYFGYAVDEICGNSAGSIDITIKGGVQPYTYAWSNGATTEDLKNIASGNYQCVVTDGMGCSLSTPVYTINNTPGTLAVKFIDVDNERCNDDQGAIELYIDGGTSPYTYTWSTGVTGTKVITGLNAGSYSCIISDQSGCTVNTGVITLLDESGTLSIDNIFTGHEQCEDASGAVDIVVSGGTGSKTYAWSNGANTEDITGLSAGTYSVIVTDGESCSVNASAVVLNNSGTLTLANIVTTPDNCGAGTGSVNLTISGGTTPYTYVWSNSATTEDLSNLVSGVYTCSIKDAGGCTLTAEANVGGSSLTIQNINIAHEICGLTNGSLEVNVTGGSGNYSYVWSNGANSKKVTGLSAGNYFCIINDEAGCSITTPQLTINGSSGDMLVDVNTDTNSQCYTAVINLTVSGGTAPYNFLWSNGATTEDIEVSSPGTYTCVVTDNNGYCRTVSADVSVLIGSPMVVVVWPLSCGSTGGEIYVDVWGGTWPYTYQWSNGATTQYLSGLSEGAYTCVIKDANGCTKTINATIYKPITGTYVVSHDCGNNTGSIDLTITGGSSEYYYFWYKITDFGWWEYSSSDEDLENLSQGKYYVYVWDALAFCSIEFYIDVENSSSTLALSNLSVINTCGNTSSGSVDLTVSGGTMPYTFAWSNGATTEDINNLGAGDYEVLIKDANGCTLTYEVSIEALNPPAIDNISVTHDACGTNTGSITLALTGGSGDYIFQWSNGMTIQNINGLSEGSYTVTVTDNVNGCKVTQSDIVVGNIVGSLAHIASVINEKCENGNGKIDLTVIGGSGNYSYKWSDLNALEQTIAVTEDLMNIKAGIYRCKITDLSDGCSMLADIEVLLEESSVAVTLDEITDDVCGKAIGQIQVTATGGDGNYLYSWSGGQTSDDISNLTAGTYTLLVTDGTSCKAQKTFTVDNYTNGFAIQDLIASHEKCGNGKGSIDLVMTGGSGNFSYSWNNGQTSEDLQNISKGTYTVTVTDNVMGCVTTQEVTLQDLPSPLTSETVVTDESCSYGNGAVELTINGGSGIYSYQWSNGKNTKDISDLSAGTFICDVKDLESNCVITVPVDVINFANTIAINTDNLINDNCTNGSGAIYVSVSGGDGQYSYQWSNGLSTQDITNLVEGTYTLVVTDGHNCQKEKGFAITKPSVAFAIANLTVTDDKCEGGKGSIDLTMTGGSGDFSYRWSNGQTTEDIFNLAASTYSVTVTDNVFGCSDTQEASVQTTLNLLAYSATIENETCENGEGAIELTVNGGSGNYAYEWSNGKTTKDLSGLRKGVYYCKVKDLISGCEKQAEAQVENDASTVTVHLDQLTDDNCHQGKGEIKISVTGGLSPYSYAWSNGSTTEDIGGLHAGTYSFTTTDAQGCSAETSFSIDNVASFSITGVEIKNATCASCNNGAISLIVENDKSYTFNWSNGKSGKDILGLLPGEYNVTITKSDGGATCTDTRKFSVEVDNSLSNRTVDIYPNPSPGIIHFKNESGEYILKIKVLDNLGKEIYTRDLPQADKSISVDLSFLSNGNYLLKVLKGSEWINYRIAIY